MVEDGATVHKFSLVFVHRSGSGLGLEDAFVAMCAEVGLKVIVELFGLHFLCARREEVVKGVHTPLEE